MTTFLIALYAIGALLYFLGHIVQTLESGLYVKSTNGHVAIVVVSTLIWPVALSVGLLGLGIVWLAGRVLR